MFHIIIHQNTTNYSYFVDISVSIRDLHRKLLLMKVSDRDRNVNKVRIIGCVWRIIGLMNFNMDFWWCLKCLRTYLKWSTGVRGPTRGLTTLHGAYSGQRQVGRSQLSMGWVSLWNIIIIIIIRAFVRRTMSASELNLRRHTIWYISFNIFQCFERYGLISEPE